MDKKIKRWELISAILTLLMPIVDAIFKLIDQYKDTPEVK